MWQGWISLILGLWLILSGLISSLQHPINLFITGVLAAVFGFWAYRHWQCIVNGVLGLWLILSGFITTLIHPLNFIIVGLVMGALGLWVGLSHPVRRMDTKTA